ncbi:MAG: TonB-dependent receptor [Bacteroidales bacterium]
MKANLLKLLTTSLLIISASLVYSQGVIKGKIVDTETREPLVAAYVVEKGTSNGTTSDAQGNFTLSLEAGNKVIHISYIGYLSQDVNVRTSDASAKELGTILLSPDAEALKGVVVTGKGVVDIAKDRETPVAVSTIKLPEIQTKSGNQEFPELMKNTPSVYVASQAGGYGEARINIRGFAQENLALLFNGQPVNGMEDGRVYWSNWQGLTEVANVVQVQRGLGSSKLAISSVGATINVVTKATDTQKGGRAAMLFGNDAYMKYTASYSTGLNKSGWGMSLLLSHWQGNGYNDGTQGQGQTYFISIGYKPSDKHSFNLSATGAPQWHNQNYSKTISTYDRNEDGDISKLEQKFNNNWGYYKGKEYSLRKNFYHKPVLNLNWDWTLSKRSSLSTVIYASVGQGGGTGNYGSSKNIVYTDNGQIDFDKIELNNKAINSAEKDYNIDGRTIGEYSNSVIRRASMNMHRWVGAVSNFNHQINEHWAFNVGADLRSYFGEHYRLVDNLWGLDGYWDDNYNAQGFQDVNPAGRVYTQEFEASPYMFWTGRNRSYDEKLDYQNNERIAYTGAFGQLEYKSDRLSAFVQGAVSNQGYQRFDYYTYSDPEEQVSKKLNHSGFNIKTGGNFNINEKHNVFANAGYFSRQPFFDNLFLNNTNEVNDDVGNEGILGLELGYGFRSKVLDIDFNAYYTKWSDRQVRKVGDFDDDGARDDVALFEDVAELHMGAELEFEARLTRDFTVSGFASIGDWEYSGNVDANLWDENRKPITSSGNTLYLDGVKVGDAAQTTLGLMGNYRITKNFSVDVDYRHCSQLYAAIDPSAFNDKDHEGSLKLPSYGLLDAGVTYRWYLKNNDSFKFRLNVNNLLDKQYISQSDTNIHSADKDKMWQGINMDNKVYFGNGATWNFSVSYNF